MKTRKILSLAVLITLTALLSGAFLYARSPFMSNRLKRIILPELSRLSERRVTAERIYLNLFPLFLGVRNLMMYDGEGKETISVEKARLYIKIPPLFRREVDIAVISVDNLRYDTDLESLKAAGLLIPSVKEGGGTSGWRVKIGSVSLKNSSLVVSVPEKALSVAFRNIRAEGNLKRRTLNLRNSQLRVDYRDRELIKGRFMLRVNFRGNAVNLKTLDIESPSSMFHLAGRLADETFEGTVRSRMPIQVLADLFDLERNPEGELEAGGRVRWKPGGSGASPLLAFLGGLYLDLGVKGRFHLETLMELLGRKVPLEGLAHASGRLEGPVLNPRLRLKAAMQEGHIYGIDVDQAACLIDYEDRVLSFRDGKVDAYNGKASVEVTLRFSRPFRFALKVEAASLDSISVLKLIKWDPGLPPGSVSGTLLSEGGAFEPRGRFEYTAWRERGAGEDRLVAPFLRNMKTATGSFSMKEHVLTLKGIRASSEKSTLSAGGFLDFNRGILELKALVTTGDLDDIYYEEGLVRGRGRFDGTVTGRIGDPLISGKASLCDLSYKRFPLGCLDAEISYDKRGLTISGLEGRLDGGNYSLEGRIDTDPSERFEFLNPRLSLDATVSGVGTAELAEWIRTAVAGEEAGKIGKLAASAGGTIHTAFTLSGPLADPSAAGHLEVEGLRIKNDYAVLKTDFSYGKDGLDLSDLTVEKGGSSLRGDLSVSRDGTIERGAFRILVISDDLALKLPPGLSLEGDLGLTGPLRSPWGEFRGTIRTSRDGPPGGSRSEIGEISLELKDGSVGLAGNLFGEQVLVTGGMVLSEDLPWKINIDIREGLYDRLAVLFIKEVPEDLFLSMWGAVDLTGTAHSVNGTIELKSFKLNLYGQDFTNTEDIVLSIEGSEVRFESFSLRTGPTALNIRGRLDLAEGYDLTIDGRAYLSPLKGFIAGLEQIQGYSDFVLAIRGEWLDPVVSGGLSVENASVAVKGFPNRFSSIKGYVYIDENRIVLETMTGRFASGDLRIRGVGRMQGFRIRDYHLEGLIKDINLHLQEGVSFKLSGDLILTRKEDGTFLIGDLRVLKGRYKKTIEWKSWILSAKRPVAHKKQPGLLDSVELNINLSGDEDIVIDNNLVTAPARIDLVILGTLKSPVLVGRVELKGGKIFFRNNEFTIINASADFTDPARLNPFFDIVARTRVKEYQIQLSLEGYVDQFNLSLSSEPMLDEVDILSLLTVGEIGTKLKGFEGGIGASEAASFLTGKLQETVEERLRNITGFDRIQVEPYVSESTGTIGPRVTVSKKLLTDKVYVTYTTSLGNTPEQSLKVEFFVSDSISLVGERDELGTLGADIKFRLEFK